MRSGSIPLAEIPGGLDLAATLESAQTFLWHRSDGGTYDGTAGDGEVSGPYHTVADGEFVRLRRVEEGLAWTSTTDAAELVERRLGLTVDLDAVFAGFPAVEPLERAREAFPGLRVVRDPLFPCLISFICSARTGVRRIYGFQRSFAERFGDQIDVEGRTYHAFPRPDQLAAAGEQRLRDLGVGFRAPYVAETAAMVADGEVTAAELRDESYREARETLQRFPGVGPKVADCVALFALGHHEAVPIDTWTRRLIERRFPALARDGYEATADAFRDRFGENAGYAQTYLYHYERTRADGD